MAVVRHKEAIHSGHFMVSNFEAEAQDDEEDIAVPVPEEAHIVETVPDVSIQKKMQNQFTSLVSLLNSSVVPHSNNRIDSSLTKLFQCMSIAYRQKLTSPKWNRFLGMKLRWKDKIRLNNVIWRCWHMQFIKGHRKLVCAFANPLEIDNHNKTEAGAIMEGKYWKRKMATILAEYKKWRMFYVPTSVNAPPNDVADIGYGHSSNFNINESWHMKGSDDIGLESMIMDADFFVDALFNSLGYSNIQTVHTNNPDLTHGGSLDSLQPQCLDDLMDLDPMAPLQDWLSSKLPDTTDPPILRGSIRGKTLHSSSGYPEQEPVIYPVQDIKDIQVREVSYHPFSHASQPAFYKGNKGFSRNSAALESSESEGRHWGVGRDDSKKTWPGKQETWEKERRIVQSHQVRGSVIQGTVESEGRGSVIQTSHRSHSNIVSRLSSSSGGPTKVSLGPRLAPGELPRSRPTLATSRHLVQLLQPEHRPKLVQKPMKSINLPLKGRRGCGSRILVPPPPPGSLPQPAFIGTSSAIIPEDSKLTSAEQKRRGTIKNGFEFLRALVPSLSQTPNVKISKAALLTKGAEYVTQLKEEKDNLNKEVMALRNSVELLSQEIAAFQAQLPTAGSAAGNTSRPSQLQDMFDRHIAACTMQNWKYWVFSRIMQPLLESYDRTVSSCSPTDLHRTAGSWLDQHASLVQLRPLVLKSLKELSVTTEVLSEPHKLPQEALNAVSIQSSQSNHSMQPKPDYVHESDSLY